MSPLDLPSASQLAEGSQAERRARDAATEFDTISRLVKSEFARFERERIDEFRDMLQAHLDGMIARQKELIAAWRSTKPHCWVWSSEHRCRLAKRAVRAWGPEALVHKMHSFLIQPGSHGQQILKGPVTGDLHPFPHTERHGRPCFWQRGQGDPRAATWACVSFVPDSSFVSIRHRSATMSVDGAFHSVILFTHMSVRDPQRCAPSCNSLALHLPLELSINRNQARLSLLLLLLLSHTSPFRRSSLPACRDHRFSSSGLTALKGFFGSQRDKAKGRTPAQHAPPKVTAMRNIMMQVGLTRARVHPRARRRADEAAAEGVPASLSRA